MSLLLDAPVEAAATPVRRRRTVLPLVAALAAAGGIALSAMSFAPRAAAFGDLRPTVAGAPFVTVPEFGARGAHILGYEHRAPVTMTVPVSNNGRLPVTITAATLEAGRLPLLTIEGARGLPLSLGAGETGQLVLTGVLDNCRYFHERALQTFDGLELAYSSLTRSGTRHVLFDRPVMVKSPMLASCPDRKLNRQADRRNSIGSGGGSGR